MDQIIIEKLNKALEDIIEKFVVLNFFGILKREGQETWDILISGSNITDKPEVASQIIRIIQKYILKEEIVNFSRLVILKQDNVFIKAFTSLFKIKNGSTRISKTKVNNLMIDEAIVFYSSKD